MQPTSRQQALQLQRNKLVNSYGELLKEFASSELRNVGNYTLGRLIGKGSFGKVYLASHKLTNGSKVVLKSANKSDANLAREIHHHRQFIHPHIARLYEVIVTESLVWLVLEYCPGDELYNHLLKTGPMEPAKVQKIFTQLVGAVSYVHNKSCVHRDLKLENILLDKHENVKLVDFGFTREYEGRSSYLQTWCGTVCYSAPEMLKGEKYAGEKVDVWSLGIILYALLCGELPFDDDDEAVTKTKILKEEPKYPNHMPQPVKELITILLSKRPLLRPTLADILQHVWLAEHAPQQQAILKLQQPAPFTTELEKETLQRMRSAGVDIDMVIENVLAQRCDSLAGWWALLIEKEERKAKRRERKRKEAEAKSLRRLSAASSRLERMGPTIRETDEESLQVPILGDPPKTRGRNMKRTGGSISGMPDLPGLPETTVVADDMKTPPPIDKDSVRSTSSSRPPPPPKERRVSRASLLHVVQTNPDLLAPPNSTIPRATAGPRRKFHPQPLLNQLANIKHWIKESAKRARSPMAAKMGGGSGARSGAGVGKLSTHNRASSSNVQRRASQVGSMYRYSSAHARTDGHARAGAAQRTKDAGAATQYNGNTQSKSVTSPSSAPGAGPSAGGTNGTNGGSYTATTPHKRLSLSPAPLTPRSSSYHRRSSTGLRGRKSTSSSVSSIRSIHHHHSHSKASSTSSTTASLASPTSASHTPTASGKLAVPRSPHSSVKVLPGTPSGSGTFPPGVRVVRKPLLGAGLGGGSGEADEAAQLRRLAAAGESYAAFSNLAPPSPGLSVFARRKRSPFKGPMLMLGGGRKAEGGLGRSGSTGRRKNGDVTIQEEEEDEDGEEADDDEDVEVVEEFEALGKGEVVVLEEEPGDVEDEPGGATGPLVIEKTRTPGGGEAGVTGPGATKVTEAEVKT